MGVMRKIERMSVSKKRKVLMQLANRTKSEKLKNELNIMNDEQVNECFMKILSGFVKEGSVKDV